MADETSPLIGALYSALAKAQSEFPPIPRTRTVTVRSDKGNYTFDYAPLDTILAVTRPILGKHALAITQSWNGDELVTVLGHESGAELRAHVQVPHADSMQKRGAALTYIRRYSIQAILGVASEEDTDGDAAGTQSVTPRNRSGNGQKNVPHEEPSGDSAPTAADLLRDRFMERRQAIATSGLDEDGVNAETWVTEVKAAHDAKKITEASFKVLREFHKKLGEARQ